MAPNTTVFIAFGHRCSAAAILDRCQLAAQSFPFDGIVSKLSVIEDCLKTDFQHFLDPRHYVKVTTRTVNVIDGVVREILTENPSVNRYYEDTHRPVAGEDLTGSSTYHLQLALTHHDPASAQDQQSFVRRIRRLRETLAQDRKKVCFYIHPLLGVNDYQRQRADLLDEFQRFGRFLAARYRHTHGLFFILVQSPAGLPATGSTCLLQTPECTVHVIHVNDGFVDASAPFAGDCERELQTMIELVQRAELSEPPRYRIYFPLFDDPEAASNEVRLTHEGLRAHPRVTLVDEPERADYLLFCQNHLVGHNPFHTRFRPLVDRFKASTILLDYGDDPGGLLDADDFRWRLYFKRSCVDRQEGRVMDYGLLPVRPTAYCVPDAMVEPPAPSGARRLDVSCLFDDDVIQTPYFALARGRLLKFAKRLAAAHPALTMQLGTVSECGPVGRSAIDPRYKQCLYDSKIVLHANPDPWEGDARLWEALAAGPLVFVDRMYAPLDPPLVDGQHLIFYDLTDDGLRILEEKVLHYLNAPDERQRIGDQGRAFALQHHRSVDRISALLHALDTSSPDPRPALSLAAAPDIVVSIATGYKDVDEYRQFIATLRRTGATCPIFLGISDGPEYETVKRYLLDNAVNTFIVPPITPGHKVVNGYRFAQYREWLRGIEYRFALLMDFRDAYFQRDPFQDVERFMNGVDLYLMSEFQLLTVGNHPNGMNYAWVEEPFGKEVADALADKEILNSGAILGRKQAITSFLEAMTEVTRGQDFAFADQGTLNYLAHTGRLDHCGRIKIERAGQSLVNNCGFSELDLLRAARPLTREEEARIAFIPRTPEGRLRLWRDHEGWVLDDDGNVSYAVHQYDRFFDEMYPFVAHLSAYDPPDRVFVNSGNRPYRGEKYTLSSPHGLKPGAVERLIRMLGRLPVGRKPLLTGRARARRGFVFTYGVLNVELLFEPPEFRRAFFEPTGDPGRRARFLERWGYDVIPLDDDEWLQPVEASPNEALTAQGFSEARAQAERWSAPG